MERDEEFFEKLYDETRDNVLSYIIIKCGRTEEISDIFQETYEEIVRVIKKRGADYIKNPKAFALQMARKKVYRHYKFLERLRGVEFYADEGECIENIEIEDFSFEKRVMDKMLVEEVFEYLSRKDNLTKKIFYLYYYMDQSIREIAESFSITESNVKNRIYRTLKEMKEYFKDKNG